MIATQPTAIRWLIRRDMARIIDIELASSDAPWSHDRFIEELKQRNCIGMVAEEGENIVGFMLYRLHKGHLHVLNLAVDPQHRKRGVGRAMIVRLMDKLSQQRRRAIEIVVGDWNLGGQLFLRSCGFKAVDVLRDHFDGDDGYLMQWKLG